MTNLKKTFFSQTFTDCTNPVVLDKGIECQEKVTLPLMNDLIVTAKCKLVLKVPQLKYINNNTELYKELLALVVPK